MGAVSGRPVPAGLRRDCQPRPGRGACGSPAGSCRRGTGLRDAGYGTRHRIAAAVVAVGVVLCLSWTHTFHFPPGFAMQDGHAIATAAPGIGAAGGTCRAPVLLAAYVQPRVAAGSPTTRAPGRRGSIPAPGIACRAAGRSLPAGHQTVPSWLAVGHGRYGGHVLASARWPAGVPVRSRRAGCPADEAAGRVQRLDAVLEPDTSGAVRLARADNGLRLHLGAGRLQPSPAGSPGLICMIRPGRPGAGARFPERWCSLAGGSGGQMGSGDRASLPGRSTRYRVIWLVCPQCGARMTCLFYDEGDAPLCQDPAHGQMEMQR